MTTPLKSPPIEQNGKLIHVAFIFQQGSKKPLFLRKIGPRHFTWFEEIQNETKKEIETDVFANTIEEAIRLGVKKWKNEFFRTLICGFRYTLPERDEHGINALFHQMAASAATINGVYFDEELKNNCFVQNASNEALDLLKELKTQNRLTFP